LKKIRIESSEMFPLKNKLGSGNKPSKWTKTLLPYTLGIAIRGLKTVDENYWNSSDENPDRIQSMINSEAALNKFRLLILIGWRVSSIELLPKKKIFELCYRMILSPNRLLIYHDSYGGMPYSLLKEYEKNSNQKAWMKSLRN